MDVFLNAYSPDVPDVELSALKALHWDGLRRDVHLVDSVPRLLDQHRRAGLRLLLLLEKWGSVQLRAEQVLRILATEGATRDEVALEPGNEWDLAKAGVSPVDAGRLWRAVAQAGRAISPETPIVTGGISALSDPALRWLRIALAECGDEPGLIVGFHAYRTRLKPTDPPMRL